MSHEYNSKRDLLERIFPANLRLPWKHKLLIKSTFAAAADMHSTVTKDGLLA